MFRLHLSPHRELIRIPKSVNDNHKKPGTDLEKALTQMSAYSEPLAILSAYCAWQADPCIVLPPPNEYSPAFAMIFSKAGQNEL